MLQKLAFILAMSCDTCGSGSLFEVFWVDYFLLWERLNMLFVLVSGYIFFISLNI